MDEENILELSEQEKLYWWHISRRSILQSVLDRFRAQFFCYPDLLLCHPERSRGISEPVLLNSSAPSPAGESAQNDIRILDVGCGTGENFYWLSKFGEVTGADTSELAVELADQKGKAVLGRTEDLPFEDGTFDLVTAFDVLEHVTDDAKVLQEWKRVLHSGGRLFLSVPAYQGLFGPHDRALGHLRRYNLRQLKGILQNNGFEVEFSSYIFCLTFPLFWLQRTLVKKSSQTITQYMAVPKFINNLLIGLGEIESWWLSFSKFAFGSSIVVLAKKNE